MADAGMMGTALPNTLIVGDIGLLLEMELSGFGFECDLAATGAEGVQAIGQRNFPLVIIATQLQDMSAVNFARSLLNHVQGTKVVLYGSGLSDADQSSLTSTGRVFCVPTSVSGHEMGERLTDLAQRGEFSMSAPPSVASVSVGLDGPPMLEPDPLDNIPGGSPAPAGADPALQQRLLAAEAQLRNKEGELAKLRAEMDSLRHSGAQVQQQLAQALSAQGSSRAELEGLRLKLGESGAAYEMLEQERALQDGRIQGLTEQLAALRGEGDTVVAELRHQLETESASAQMAKTRIAGLEEMLGEVRLRVQELEQERSNVRTEAEGLRARVADAATAKARVEQQMAELHFDRDEARKEAEDLRRQNQNLNAELEALQGQRDEGLEQIRRQQERVDELDGMLQQVSEQRDQAMRQLQEADSKALELGSQVDQLSFARQDVQLALQEAQQQRDQWAEQHGSLSEQFAQQQAEVEALRSQYEMAQSQLAETQEALQAAQSSAAELGAEAEILRSQHELAQSQITETQEALQAAQSSSAELEAESELIREQLTQSQAQLSEVQAHLAASQSAQQLGAENQSQLQGRVQALEHANAELEQSNDETLAQLSDLESELNLLRASEDESSALQQQFGAISEEKSRLQALVDNGKIESKRLEAEISALKIEDDRLRDELQKSNASQMKNQAEKQKLQQELDNARSMLDAADDDFIVVDEEDVRSELMQRLAKFRGLVDSLGPFTWGLQQAIQHVEMLGEETSDPHLKQLRLLLAVITRVIEELGARDTEVLGDQNNSANPGETRA